MSFASNAAGVKNLAIGAGVLVGGALAVYLAMKLWKGGAAVAKEVADDAGYIFGTRDDKSIGTDFYNWTHPDSVTGGPDSPSQWLADPAAAPQWWDADQAAKTRAALHAR